MTPRGKRAKAADKTSASSELVKALKFVALAQKEVGQAYQTHVMLAHNQAVAFDGVIAVGHPIEEDLNVCPHTYRLIDALGRCKKAVAITQLDAEKLVVKSGNFRAIIPCLNPAALPSSASRTSARRPSPMT